MPLLEAIASENCRLGSKRSMRPTLCVHGRSDVEAARTRCPLCPIAITESADGCLPYRSRGCRHKRQPAGGRREGCGCLKGLGDTLAQQADRSSAASDRIVAGNTRVGESFEEAASAARMSLAGMGDGMDAAGAQGARSRSGWPIPATRSPRAPARPLTRSSRPPAKRPTPRRSGRRGTGRRGPGIGGRGRERRSIQTDCRGGEHLSG